MIGMFPPQHRQIGRALADLAALRPVVLARVNTDRKHAHVRQVSQNGPPAAQRRDQTPSPCGQRHATAPTLPASFALAKKRIVRYGSGIRTGGLEPQSGLCVNPGTSRIEGAGPCPYEHSFLPLPPVAALPPVAIRWANRPLAVQPSVPAPQRSPAAALRRARPSVLRATSRIASLIPAAADLTSSMARASARRLHTLSHPRTGSPVTGLSAFIPRPRRTPHVQ